MTVRIGAVARDVLGRRVPCLCGGLVDAGNCRALIACPHGNGLFTRRAAWDAAGCLDIPARCADTIGENA